MRQPPEENSAPTRTRGGEGLAPRSAHASELDRIGPVDTEVSSELQEISERLGFLDSQTGDLAQARKALNETLAKIEEESERLFVETFEEVRTNFQRIFRQLFGGGRADVKLAENEPVLEAGVEIMARPPGREMLPIGLLSGGQRTMTALALLFAVFEARPSPFCILDEVDAFVPEATGGKRSKGGEANGSGDENGSDGSSGAHGVHGAHGAGEANGATGAPHASAEPDLIPDPDPGEEPEPYEEPEPAHEADRSLVDPESGERVVELLPARPDPQLAPRGERRE